MTNQGLCRTGFKLPSAAKSMMLSSQPQNKANQFNGIDVVRRQNSIRFNIRKSLERVDIDFAKRLLANSGQENLVKKLRLVCFILMATFFALTESKSIFADDVKVEFTELKGIIHDAEKKPIEDATVMIWTAAEKKGYSIYCPGCYFDCGKRATSDKKGEFVNDDFLDLIN